MKVYLSCDMEGVTGVVHPDQTDPANSEYPRARRLMLGEVNAAIEGALAAGAEGILVNDAHWNSRNLMIEDLNPAATLLSGYPRRLAMMAGIERDYDAAFFTGYHARVGTASADIDHTYMDPERVQGVWLNGIEVGEYGINAALAGYFGVPVNLVTGDQCVCAQAKELLGADLETVVVKESIGRNAAKNLHPDRARDLIRAAAERALKKSRNPFVLPAPITVRIAFTRSSQAERASIMPGSHRTAPRVVEYTHEDFGVVFNGFYALLILADIRS